MRENRLRTLLNEGKPSFGTRVRSSWPTITELVGRSQNFDYVEFLAEYAPYDLYALDNIARAIGPDAYRGAGHGGGHPEHPVYRRTHRSGRRGLRSQRQARGAGEHRHA